MLKNDRIQKALTDPLWFLAGVDASRETLEFLRTHPQLLKEAPFHDGRTPLANLPIRNLTIDFSSVQGAVDLRAARRPTLRVLAHTAFCGSTLLARILGDAGKVTSYREPQALVHLSDAIAADAPSKVDSIRWRIILSAIVAKYSTPFDAFDVAFVKPSNWANGALPNLFRAAPAVRMVIIDQSVEAFLVANLRGARSRLAFSHELLNALAATSPFHRRLAKAIDVMPVGQMQKLLRLLATCLDAQRDVLAVAAATLAKTDEPAPVVLDRALVLADPAGAALRARDVLDLPLSDLEITTSATRFGARNAKLGDDAPFDHEDEQRREGSIREKFSAEIEAAVDWARRAFEGRLASPIPATR